MPAADQRAESPGESTDEPADDPIEPGTPRLENALLVLLGIVSTLAVVAHLIHLFG